MRLLVSCIPYDSGKSGISVYTREVVRELHEAGHELTLLCEPGLDTSEFPEAARKEFAPRWTRRAPLSMFWHLVFLPRWIRRRRGDFDGFVICAANRRVCASYPLPTAATVHDLANFHIAGKYSPARMFYLAHVLPFFAKKSQHLVAVSGATKTDMVRYWHTPEDAVTVLYNGFAKPDAASMHESGEQAGAAPIVYVSRIEHPGKNHVRLIEAYGKLPRELAEAHPLVFAGAEWKDAQIVHEAAEKCVHGDLISFAGFVKDMDGFWKKAGFCVFPSLFEGFGLPLVEAMARGIPCACSNNGSLGEIAGDVAEKFDPHDADDIARALETLLTESPDARARRIERAKKHVEIFSWSAHAKGLVRLLQGNTTIQ